MFPMTYFFTNKLSLRDKANLRAHCVSSVTIVSKKKHEVQKEFIKTLSALRVSFVNFVSKKIRNRSQLLSS